VFVNAGVSAGSVACLLVLTGAATTGPAEDGPPQPPDDGAMSTVQATHPDLPAAAMTQALAFRDTAGRANRADVIGNRAMARRT
jgi:hypothetical protein